MADYIFFSVAFAFFNPNSVLPGFVRQLTDVGAVVGLVTTVYNGGWLLPQLLTAHLINDKPRKKPYLLRGISGRVLFWVLALTLWLGVTQNVTLTLVLFFTYLALFAISDGVASVAWFDILARAIPLKRRGRLMGIAQVVSGVAGLGAGAAITAILSTPRLSFPADYALIFALAGGALVPSAIAILLIREPPPERDSSEAEVETQDDDSWLKPLTKDPAFRRLIICRIMVGMISLATPFYVGHAADVLDLPESVIGSFVATQTLAQATAGLVLGLVSERWGPRHVIQIGSGIAIMGPLFALAAHLSNGNGSWLVKAYPLTYASLGVVQGTWMLGFYNYLLEIAPDDTRPVYIGLSNTIMGMLTLMPTAGGWLLDATSHTVLFGLTGGLVASGFLFTLTLESPEATLEAQT